MRSTFVLAGWLFADLLLGLTVLFIASMPPVQRHPTPTFTPTWASTATATVTPTWTTTFTPMPTPTATLTLVPSPTVVSDSLNPIPFEQTLHVNVKELLNGTLKQKESERARLQALLKQTTSPFAGKRAGFVLTFGAANPTSPTLGNQLADQVNQVLRATSPEIFGQAVMESYHVLNADLAQQGIVQMRIYFFSR